MKILLASAAILSALTLSGAAHAASCSGKLSVDTVYQEGSNGNFQYYVQLRNNTMAPLAADIAFANFPSGVSLFSPHLLGVKVGVNDKNIEKLRFGKGSNSQIHNGTISRFYDSPSGGNKPYVLVTNCR